MSNHIFGFFHSGKTNPDEKIHAVPENEEKTICGLKVIGGKPFVESEYPYADQSYCQKCAAKTRDL